MVKMHEQMLWPDHCVQGSEQAKILLDASFFQMILPKGPDKGFHSYSGFEDDNGQPTIL